MKPQGASKWFAALLLVGLLTSGFESHALPPRQHAARGVIESIDRANQTLVLADPKTKTTRVYVWNNSTRFRQDGRKTTAGTLQAGIAVKGYYRKEVGRWVLRELRWRDPAPRIHKAATQRSFEDAPRAPQRRKA